MQTEWQRPTLDMKFIEAVMMRWGLFGTPLSVDDLGGSFNCNWHVVTTHDDVVVRVRPPWLTEKRIGDIHALLEMLNRAALPTPRLRRSRGGQTYEFITGRLVEVYDYLVERSNRRWTAARWESSFAHMGRLHVILGRNAFQMTPPLISNYASPRLLQLMMTATLHQVEALLPSSERAEGIAICNEALRVLEEIAEYFETHDAPLPGQLVHGDFHLDNLLFDEATNVLYTLDFDFTAWRERIYDVAYALRLSLPQLTESEDCRLNSKLVREWLRVYDDSSPEPLTEDERRALPYELAQAAIFYIADACRADDPLGQVLRESPYLELACHLVQYPESLLGGC